MHRSSSISGIVLTLLIASSCANKDTGPGPRATVMLRDGTKFAGMVTNSSAGSVTIAGEGNNSRTFDMKEVRSIEYEDAATEAAVSKQPREAAPRKVREVVPHVDHYHPDESAIRTRSNELRVGTEIQVRTEETIDAKKAAEGQAFAAEVSKDVLDAAGDVVIPRGSNAKIVIRSKTKGGKILGSSDLYLDLDSVAVDGRQYKLDTADLDRRGADGLGKNKRTVEYVGGGAAVGSVIGAIFGQGKGAAIGAASGAAAGATTEVVTRGSIRVPVETLLTFQLDKALRVTASR